MRPTATDSRRVHPINKSDEWWHEPNPMFRLLLELVPRQTTRVETDYVVKKLGLQKGMSFLDCPCGLGRISLALAKRGIRVTGVDIVPSYLDQLDTTARRQDLRLRMYCSDMRRIRFESEFDAAGNLGNSFGYFDKESDNLLTLKNIFRALKPGGKFMLHVINRDWLLTHYLSSGWFEAGGFKIVETRHFDLETSINHNVSTFIKEGKEEHLKIDIRMYSYHELITRLRSVGFTELEGYGSTKDDPISLQTRMMFVIGTKPKQARSASRRSRLSKVKR
jgi:SAM-dependent methyltransferase